MKITQLYVYPIKSLRGVSLSSSKLCSQGLLYDRQFMILQVQEDGSLKNMHVAHFPEMTLFHPSISDDSITVSYRKPLPLLIPESPAQNTTIEFPLVPEFSSMERIDVKMHSSPTVAYNMGQEYNNWFSECFGYKVVLAYLGDGKRQVLGTMSPNSQQKKSWLSSISSYVSGTSPDGLAFSDCAPFLVVSEASLQDVHPRLQGDEQFDLTKFRPNIVVDGENEWDEDFWGELQIRNSRVVLTANCGRCKSINIDYSTGRPGTGEGGTMLKKLMKDRRVDAGVKYSPVFGRYGFLSGRNEGPVEVGDEVVVSKRNSERTKFDWPGLMN